MSKNVVETGEPQMTSQHGAYAMRAGLARLYARMRKSTRPRARVPTWRHARASMRTRPICTRWFKYDQDYLCVNKSQFVPVIFEPPCIISDCVCVWDERSCTPHALQHQNIDTAKLGATITTSINCHANEHHTQHKPAPDIQLINRQNI